MAYRFLDLDGLSDAPRLWKAMVAASPDAWVWATYSNYLFRLAYLRAKGTLVADRSFILSRDGRPCGLAPVVIARDTEIDELIATYGDVPLSWPMLDPRIGDVLENERIIFDEIERRTREAGAGRINLMFAPPNAGAEFTDRFRRVVRERGFIDTSYMSHCLDVSPDTLGAVRERYRRYVRKFRDQFDLKIIGTADVTEDLAATYMELHVKDTGGVFRPLATYERQVDQVRASEAFFVHAFKRAEQKVAGMLLIQFLKNAAFDASVAVDPQFEHDGVSYLLKWRAIEHLIDLGVRHYELGRAALSPTFLWQPTVKNYGISFFKDGWSRGQLKPVWSAERFYSAKALSLFLDRTKADLIRHFSLQDSA